MSGPADDADGAPTGDLLPEELPPVAPPSAGFIVQLFLIPAIIVAGVVAVWFVFGKLADSETDWRELVVDLRSANNNERWRAAEGFATLLQNEEILRRRGELDELGTQPLSETPEVAKALLETLADTLSVPSTEESELLHQSFLIRSVAVLRADPDLTLPVLAKAAEESQPAEVRQNAIMAIAFIAGREFERATGIPASGTGDGSIPVPPEKPLSAATIADQAALSQILTAAQSDEAALRRLAAGALGSISGPDSIEELGYLLDDADAYTRMNAAIGLIRNGSLKGLPTLFRMLEESDRQPTAAEFEAMSEEDKATELARRTLEVPMVVRNSFLAIGSVWQRLDPEQQRTANELADQIQRESESEAARTAAVDFMSGVESGFAATPE